MSDNIINNNQEPTGIPEAQPTTKGGWSGGEKLRVAINVASMILLALGILVGVNYLAARHYVRKDITFSREFALSDKTKNVLANLPTPITIYLLVGPPELLQLSGRNPRIIIEAQARLRDLLEEYKIYSNQISWEEIRFIEKPEKFEALQKQLKTPLDFNDIIVVAAGREKIVKISETYETDAASPWQQPTKLRAFKGEEAITTAILNVTQAKKKVIGFLKGHGEAGIEKYTVQGYSTLNLYLKRDNMETKEIDLVTDPEGLNECNALVIAGPTKIILSGEWDLINAYLEKGGHALIMINPYTTTGLKKYLTPWGVKVNDDIVIDTKYCAPSISGMKVISCIAANNYNQQHPITNKLSAALRTYFPMARSVERTKKPNASLTIIALIHSSNESWSETNIKSILQSKLPEYNEGKDKKGPLSLGVAVTKSLTPTGEARLVVFGDADLISNGYIDPRSTAYLNTPDLVMNSLRWLVQEESLISIEPKKARELRIELTPARTKWLFWVTLVGLPFFSILLGIFVWLMRRK